MRTDMRQNTMWGGRTSGDMCDKTCKFNTTLFASLDMICFVIDKFCAEGYDYIQPDSINLRVIYDCRAINQPPYTTSTGLFAQQTEESRQLTKGPPVFEHLLTSMIVKPSTALYPVFFFSYMQLLQYAWVYLLDATRIFTKHNITLTYQKCNIVYHWLCKFQLLTIQFSIPVDTLFAIRFAIHGTCLLTILSFDEAKCKTILKTIL